MRRNTQEVCACVCCRPACWELGGLRADLPLCALTTFSRLAVKAACASLWRVASVCWAAGRNSSTAAAVSVQMRLCSGG